MLPSTRQIEIKHHVQDEIEHYKAIKAEPAQAAMWLASDYLRHLGVNEREFACPIIKVNWPAAYAIIEAQFGHYIPH